VKKSEWYLKRNLATVVSWRHKDGVQTKHPSVIRLAFVPKLKTKLCLNHQLGHCPVGQHCPFAHGSSELHTTQDCNVVDSSVNATSPSLAATSLAEDGDKEKRDDKYRPSAAIRTPDGCCAICRSTQQLIKHAVVPPSLRRWLPSPYRNTVNEDYLWVCFQCNPRVRLVYDQMLKSHYADADELICEKDRVNIHRVKRVVGYSQLLAAALEPEEHPSSAVEAVLDDDSDLCDADDFATTATTCPRKKRGHRVTAQSTQEACQNRIPNGRLEEMRAYVAQNWKDTKLHEIVPELNEGGDKDVDAALLHRLSRVVPGEVRARATVNALVNGDAKKAHEFVSRWRLMFEQAFRPQIIPWRQD